jgi:hypothetical protein
MKIQTQFVIVVIFALILALLKLTLLAPYTRYSPSYSEEKFSSIQVGDESEKVIQLFGEPLRIQSVEETHVVNGAKALMKALIYTYSEPVESSSHYDRRLVYITGKVVFKIISDYCD